MSDSDLLVRRIVAGGVYYNISGKNVREVFSDLAHQISLPAGVNRTALLEGLLEREGLMTTSVGNGIALPHPRNSMVTSEDVEQVSVCFLDKPVSFDAMDGKPVYVLFMILSAGSGSHLKILSRLSYLFQQDSFRAVLKQKPDTDELVQAIRKYM